MQHLGLALYAEGPTDYHFLSPLLERLCVDMCVREAREPIEVSEVRGLDDTPGMQGEPRARRVLAAAKASLDAWRILFVHADGAGDPARARTQQAEPALGLLRQELGNHGIGVAVIPVRETETWAIVDGDALRQVFGTTLPNNILGLPLARRAEATLDPKVTLENAFLATNPSGRRRRAGYSPLLNALGEQVSLPCLRQLVAFQALENELRAALQSLRILR